MARLALLIGIDDYAGSPLYGCVRDAEHLKDLLDRHADGSSNFDCRLLVSSQQHISRGVLLEELGKLFTKEAEAALFYFAGHGTENNLGGYLATQDALTYSAGVGMAEVLHLANASSARERIIILDCCHSGHLGNLPVVNNSAVLNQGVTVLSACRQGEGAVEEGGAGLFTSLVCNALQGGAADVCGKVTVAGIYAYADETLTAWEQRPLFKSHVATLISIRNCIPAVELEVLRLLPAYFPRFDMEYPLDPSYEPYAEPRNSEHEAIFAHLQQLRSARLVEPVGEKHLYHAALNSKSCRLTQLGRFYWRRAKSNKF